MHDLPAMTSIRRDGEALTARPSPTPVGVSPARALRTVVPRPDVVIMVGVMVGLGLIYLSIQRGSTPAYDAAIYIEVTTNLVDHGSLVVRNDAYGINTPYSAYGLGLSLVLVPFYGIQQLIRPGRQEILLLTNAVLIPMTAALVYAAARLLRWNRLIALLAAASFGLLTLAPQQSTDLFSEPGVGLFLMMAIVGLLAWRERLAIGPWMLGGGVAGAVLFRPDSLVLVAPLLLCIPLFVPVRELRHDRRWLARLVPIVALAVTYQLWYNWFRYGSIFTTQYQGLGFTTPFWTGFTGNVVSPGKGLFVFCPFLILAVPGFAILARRDRAIVAALGLAALLRPLFYARWASWEAGVGWGPRFMYPLCALLMIPAFATVRWVLAGARPRRIAGTSVVAVLAAAGIGLSALSVLVPFERWFHIVSDGWQPPDVAARRVHDYYWTFGGNHIAGNIRLLDDVEPPNLAWFRSGHLPLGPLFLVAGVAVLTASVMYARRCDRRSAGSAPAGLT